jgi:hypothetical protein
MGWFRRRVRQAVCLHRQTHASWETRGYWVCSDCGVRIEYAPRHPLASPAIWEECKRRWARGETVTREDAEAIARDPCAARPPLIGADGADGTVERPGGRGGGWGILQGGKGGDGWSGR